MVNDCLERIFILCNLLVSDLRSHKVIKRILKLLDLDKIRGLHALDIRLCLVLGEAIETFVNHLGKLLAALKRCTKPLSRMRL